MELKAESLLFSTFSIKIFFLLAYKFFPFCLTKADFSLLYKVSYQAFF